MTNGKRALILLVGACLSPLFSAQASNKALALMDKANVYQYNISADGAWSSAWTNTWTQGRLICAKTTTDPDWIRCKYVGSTIYVMAMGKKTGSSTDYAGKVIRFRRDGMRLDDDCLFSFEGKGDGLAITPDEKYVFVSSGDSAAGDGRVLRYSVDTKTLDTDFVVFAAQSFLRECCCDKSGNLFVANRKGSRVYMYEVTHQTGEYSDTVYKNRSDGLENVGAVCFSPVENCLYAGGNLMGKFSTKNLAKIGTTVATTHPQKPYFAASAIIKGVPYFVSAQNAPKGIYAVDSDTLGQNYVYKAAPNDICELPPTGLGLCLIFR